MSSVFKKVHKRPAAALLILVAAAGVLITGGRHEMLPAGTGRGLCWPSAGEWPVAEPWATLLNLAVLTAVMLMMHQLNRRYNILRAVSYLPLGFFALFQGAEPSLVLQLNTGPLLALTVAVCLYIMMSCFASQDAPQRVFGVFALLSLGTATQYCFALAIPVFWLVCAQMRVFNGRTFAASLLGIATPWAILLGCGIVDPARLQMPHTTGVFEYYDLQATAYVLAASTLVALVMIVSVGLNVLKTIAYNARSRACNGAVTLVGLSTLLAMAADYSNLSVYLPLANMCAALQLTHYLTAHPRERQWLVPWCAAGVYALIYTYRIFFM